MCIGLTREESYASSLGILWGRIFYFFTLDCLKVLGFIGEESFASSMGMIFIREEFSTSLLGMVFLMCLIFRGKVFYFLTEDSVLEVLELLRKSLLLPH